MKGTIKSDHASTAKYALAIIGLPPLTVTKVGGLTEETTAVDLPDRTKASGGDTNPSELTVSIPGHHLVEQAAMELWFAEGKDPVSPTYKKAGALIIKTPGGKIARTFSLLGVWVMKRATPDLEMKGDGEEADIEWTLSVDSVMPV